MASSTTSNRRNGGDEARQSAGRTDDETPSASFSSLPTETVREIFSILLELQPSEPATTYLVDKLYFRLASAIQGTVFVPAPRGTGDLPRLAQKLLSHPTFTPAFTEFTLIVNPESISASLQNPLDRASLQDFRVKRDLPQLKELVWHLSSGPPDLTDSPSLTLLDMHVPKSTRDRIAALYRSIPWATFDTFRLDLQGKGMATVGDFVGPLEAAIQSAQGKNPSTPLPLRTLVFRNKPRSTHSSTPRSFLSSKDDYRSLFDVIASTRVEHVELPLDASFAKPADAAGWPIKSLTLCYPNISINTSIHMHLLLLIDQCAALRTLKVVDLSPQEEGRNIRLDKVIELDLVPFALPHLTAMFAALETSSDVESVTWMHGFGGIGRFCRWVRGSHNRFVPDLWSSLEVEE